MILCTYRECGQSGEGQMLVCAPHWSFLPQELRDELLACWDQRQAELREGNLRAATRLAWREVSDRAHAELDTVRRRLEGTVGHNVGTDGRTWRREQRRLEEREQSEEAAT